MEPDGVRLWWGCTPGTAHLLHLPLCAKNRHEQQCDRRHTTIRLAFSSFPSHTVM